MNRTKRKHVLSVGLACVDFINVVATYPKEDSDKRGENYYWQRGGNASNMCTVLNLLSSPCEFMGVLGTVGSEASWLINDFKKYNIQTDKCVLKDVQCPVTTSILCRDTGSRTIIYYPRDHPELSYSEFNQNFNVDGSKYSWIHFELSSNISDVCQMMQSALTSRSSQFDHDEGPAAARVTTKPVVEKQPNVFGDVVKSNPSELTTRRAVVSLEVEKPELVNAEEAIGYADVVFISKDFAKSRGFSDGATAVAGLYALCKPGAILICAWGDKGASACYSCKDSQDLCVVTSPAVQNINIVDSLGAGDSFVAGVIHTLVKRVTCSSLLVLTDEGGHKRIDWRYLRLFEEEKDSSIETVTPQCYEEDKTVRTRGTKGVNSSCFDLNNSMSDFASVIEDALKFGCRVAGMKCSIYGYDGVEKLV